ncbi:MAG: DUF4373 domain-containing protein [Acidaminococcales bacterium]|jgi:hypothetical protein|nr:DUF4373 domain-containing protein [Acidaminococcales bacterium]
MARPLKEGMDYFKHDTDAAGDEKIDALRANFGNDGYAFYFILLERIYKTDNAELDLSIPEIENSIVKKVGISKNKFKKILDFAIILRLFDRISWESKKILTSAGIKKRQKVLLEKRENWRSGKGKDDLGDGVFRAENPGENPPQNATETPISKVKISKDKLSLKDVVVDARARASEPEPPGEVDAFPEKPFDFAAYFAQRYPIPNMYWRDSLVDLGGDYPPAWLEKATGEFLRAGATSIKYLESTLLKWRKAGGEAPWDARAPVGGGRRAPPKQELELERDRQRKIRAGILPPDEDVVVDVGLDG